MYKFAVSVNLDLEDSIFDGYGSEFREDFFKKVTFTVCVEASTFREFSSRAYAKVSLVKKTVEEALGPVQRVRTFTTIWNQSGECLEINEIFPQFGELKNHHHCFDKEFSFHEFAAFLNLPCSEGCEDDV